jgi:acyl carrier protein
MSTDNSHAVAMDNVRDFIKSELIVSSSDVTDDQELLMSGLLDSMNVMRLVGFLETEFSTTIPPEDVIIENFSSISQISRYMQSGTSA